MPSRSSADHNQPLLRGIAPQVPSGPSASPEIALPSVDDLWAIHCGHLNPVRSNSSTLLPATGGGLTLSDPLVDDLWQLFHGLLGKVQLYPIHQVLQGQGSDQWEVELSAGGCSTPILHIFYVTLRGCGQQDHVVTAHPQPDLTREMYLSLSEQPQVVLPILEFFVAVVERQRRERGESIPQAKRNSSAGPPTTSVTSALGRVYCCVVGDPCQATPFDLLRASSLGRLLSVCGTVVRMSPPRIICIRMTYQCTLCGAVKEVAAEDGLLVYPGPCSGRCRGYKWQPMPSAATTEEMQLLKIQEKSDFYVDSGGGQSKQHGADAAAAAGGGNGVSHMIEVELRFPLLDRVAVGDTVCVCGVLTSRRAGDRKSGTVQQIAMRARSITTTTSMGNGLQQPNPDGGGGADAKRHARTWSPEESGAFYEMTRQPQWFERLAASVAPSLYGLQEEKEALLLSILGGSSDQKLGARSNIHLLLIGDPGLGKSQLLRAACRIAPRSSFVCAHTSSSCGLTMTLSRDAVTGEATLEAGAVVHGDGGITCIDEMDKGASDHKALLEVMEQETVSIAKAGMIFSMPVHTAVLAAGNPVGGHFDFSKPLTANLNISPALLSRFDIVVCMRDRGRGGSGAHRQSPTGATAAQSNLTAHVLALHRHPRHGSSEAGASPEGPKNNSAANRILPQELVRTFVLFARSQCQPTLSAAACAVLKTHYLEERARLQSGSGAATEASVPPSAAFATLPVTPRYLQGLIRVAEARAKAELRHEVLRGDADYAVNLMQVCRSSLGASPPDVHPSLLSSGGVSGGPAKGKRKSTRDVVLTLLKVEVGRAGGVNRLSHQTIIRACEEAGCANPLALLHQLNEFGLLLKSGDGYKLQGL